MSRAFYAEELKDVVVKQVVVHVGERSTTMLLGVIEVGYTLNKELVLNEPSAYSNVRVNMANISIARVGDEFFQLLLAPGGRLHLYLPSVVDDDEKVWKQTK